MGRGTSDEQRADVVALAGSIERREAAGARAVLLTLAGWTSPRIAEAFGVGEDYVCRWRSDFASGGTAASKASIAPEPPPKPEDPAHPRANS
jgi:transposase